MAIDKNYLVSIISIRAEKGGYMIASLNLGSLVIASVLLTIGVFFLITESRLGVVAIDLIFLYIIFLKSVKIMEEKTETQKK